MIPGEANDLVLRSRILLNRMTYRVFAEANFAEEVEDMLRELTNFIEAYQEALHESVARENRAWSFVYELAAVVKRASNPLLPDAELLKEDARAVLARMDKL